MCGGGVVCAGVGGLWAGGVWLRMWCVGRARGGGDSHSQAKDNAVCVCVCVCVCVYGGAGGVCGVWCVVCGVWRVRAGCVRAGGMCACACACVRVRARACVCVCVAGGGVRDVCVHALGAGGVCVRVCVWCVGCSCGWFGQRQRQRVAARQRTTQWVCGMGMVWVCVGGGGGPACGACGVCGGRAETDRVRQRITCMDGYPASSACVF